MQWYLKDAVCSQCGSTKIVIHSYYLKDRQKRYVDGASCENCLKEVILPPEEFEGFVKEFGRNR